MSQQQNEPTIVKISANLPATDYQLLKRLAAEQNITMTDVLRRALRLEELVLRENKAGSKLILRSKRGDREVLPR